MPTVRIKSSSTASSSVTRRDREPNISKPHKQWSAEPLQTQNQKNWQNNCQHWVTDSVTLFHHWCGWCATIQRRHYNHLRWTEALCSVPARPNLHPTPYTRVVTIVLKGGRGRKPEVDFVISMEHMEFRKVVIPSPLRNVPGGAPHLVQNCTYMYTAYITKA